MAQWADVTFGRVFQDGDETLNSDSMTILENGYKNQAGGFSRFPGLTNFSLFPSRRVYLHSTNNRLIAATEAGRVYDIAFDGKATDVTGVPVSGRNRVIFTDTDDEIAMAAGGPIISLNGPITTLLSSKAPSATHVAYLLGYLIAAGSSGQEFSFSNPGDFVTWDPLNVISANSKPSDLTAIQVSPYGEIMAAKRDAVEQFETLPNGVQPFARRWSTGEGIAYPYTLIADKTGTYGVTERFEFVRFTGQVSSDQSRDVGLQIEGIDDWTDAWAQELAVRGQKTIILQMPNAKNRYGTKGVTLLLDYRAQQWSQLFGWDSLLSVQTRFPAWSVARCWGKVFAGVPGGVAVFDEKNYTLAGATYSFVMRTGHIAKFGPMRCDNFRLRLKRGNDSYQGQPQARIAMRVNRDNLGFDRWMFEDMGRPGDSHMVIDFGPQGEGNTMQFEIRITDDVPVEIVSAQMFVERLRW